MLKYIEWFEKIKKMTNDSKIKQKQIKDSEYTFEKYMEFLVKNELKKRIIKKQNEKIQKLQQVK